MQPRCLASPRAAAQVPLQHCQSLGLPRVYRLQQNAHTSAAAAGAGAGRELHWQQQHCSHVAGRSARQPSSQQCFHDISSRHHPIQHPHSRTPVQCCASKSSGGSSSKPQQQQRGPVDLTNNMDDMEDVILVGSSDDEDDFEDEADLDDDDGFVEFGEDDDVISDEDADFEDEADGLLGIGSDDDPGPEVLTGNVEWGDKALEAAEAVLARPENSNLSLYLFRVIVPSKTIEIRLDKLDDVYGSPGLEDIERFSRALAQGMEAELGVEAAGEISFEVSSPGAERTLIIPQDLLRFKDLPMRVEYMSEVGTLQNVVLKFLELDEANSKTTWELADVKANQNVKGRGLSKKQRMQRYDIPLEALERVRIYVDF